MNPHPRGLTLLELAVSIALIAILTAITIPVYQSFQVKNDLDLATTEVVHALRRAQLHSQAVDGNSTWGVNISSENITLFKGSNYTTRDTAYDEITPLPSSLSASGLTEVTFSTLYGLPTSTGTITLTSSTNQTRQLTLNAKGTITY